MGSTIEINDTLQITSAQGFPDELKLEKHLENPLSAKDFENRIFEFKDKKGIRIYQAPPVRNFLVENQNGEWIYWGLIHVIQIAHDYENQVTSGKFKIVYLYTPEEIKKAHDFIDRNEDTRS